MLRNFFSRICRRLNYYKHFFSQRELHVSYGEDNPDKIFYVIGIDYDTQGLLAIVKNVLIHIEYAKDKGYVPIVDMKNFSSQFRPDNSINAWELFFRQPKGYDLADISNSKNIILSRNIDTWLGHSIFLDILDKEQRVRHDKLQRIYKECIVPGENLANHIESITSQIIGNKTNILGVLCRGTDYTQKKPHGHPVQPTFEQLCQKVDEFLDQYDINFIYVATEDAEYLDNFKLRYGDKVLYINQKRFGKLQVDFISQMGMQHYDLLKLNMDYYASLNILAHCDYFIGGRTAGTIGVSFMANEYKDYYYFRLGNYA